jgi:N-methylhydantoinase A
MSAYIAPIINEYLSNLGDRLKGIGLIPEIRVMQSNGGVMSAATAKTKAIQTLFSGPVGGTIAGVHIGKTLGVNRLICVDMGGTSFDVSLVVDHKAEVEPQTELQGLPILSPTVSINTIGAGGGSIAYLSAGALRVGPKSAGAIPGPACYGRGGTEPTVTDANLALGRLPQIARLGGSLLLDVEAGKRALDSVGSKLNLDAEATASGIIAIVNSAMANAIREITVSRGIDPRDFALVAFGGAGPLHAIAIAEELELGSVIIPSNPGVLSAYGMLQADTRHDLVTNYFENLDELDGEHFSDTLEGLIVRATEILDAEGVNPKERSLELSVDLRYTGQEYTVRVEWPSNWTIDEAIKKLPSMFEAEHLTRYGHNNPGERIEIVNQRVTAIGKNSVTEQLSPATETSKQARLESLFYFNGAWFDGIIVNRSTLTTADVVFGPAVILEPDCTSLIHPGWKATVTKGGHLMVERLIHGN